MEWRASKLNIQSFGELKPAFVLMLPPEHKKGGEDT
jgi:hypothetical protein